VQSTYAAGDSISLGCDGGEGELEEFLHVVVENVVVPAFTCSNASILDVCICIYGQVRVLLHAVVSALARD
jgi:hypothetical protein